MKTIAILLFSLAYTFAATINGQIGSSVFVAGNTDTTINFPGSSSFSVRLTGDANVTIAVFTNVAVTLPSGISALSFGTNVGYTFTTMPSNVGVVSATFTTPPITTASLITANAQAHVLQWDASASMYSDVDAQVQPVNVVDKQFVVQLPAQGTYVFVVINVGTYVPSFYGRKHIVPANTPQWWSFPNGLYLELNSGNNNHITVNYTQTNTKGKDASNKVPYGAFFHFISDVETNLTATIKFHYDNAVLTANKIEESSLQIGFYDDASGSWQFLSSGGSVDTSSKMVIQTTDHFSFWGVYGKDMSSSAASLFSSGMIIVVTVASALLML